MTLVSTETGFDARKAVALRSLDLMASGTPADFAAVLHPEFFNHEQRDEPPATRGPSAAEVHGVAAWLRAAYAELRWDVHEVVAQDDLVVVHCTMSGRHTGDFVAYDLDGRVADVFAPTGRRFATTQSHWLRMRDGRLAEHWADRDDLGTAEQLGWVPPTPWYLLRCAVAGRRARRAADSRRRAEERPFGPYAGALDEVEEAALRALAPLVTRPLDDAFADVALTVHHVVAERDLVVAHLTVGGRHVAPFHAERGRVLPPTGRTFAATQTHWLRMTPDGAVAAHWANRDDLGMATQLDWIPPSPRYLLRMALARRRAVRT